MKDVLVSICCISYNQEQFIKDALEGFVMQKTDFPFEIVISDDCSKDGTRKIIEEYKAKYPELIRDISPKENMGSMQNFLYVQRSAKGKYIALCEGDDYWIDPLKLQKQVDFMEAHPNFSMCFTNSVMKNVNTGEEKAAILNAWDEDTPSELILYHTDFSGDNLQCCPGHTSTILYRRNQELLDDRPAWMDNALTGDIMLFLSLAKYGNAKFLNSKMSVYRVHGGGISSQRYSYEKVYQERIYIFKNMKAFYGHAHDHQINIVLSHYYYALAKYTYKSQKLYAKSIKLLFRSWMISPFHFREMTKNNGMLIRK